MTRLGGFWYFLATNFITKVAQMFGNILGRCENHRFLSQTGEVTFWATFKTTWVTFYSNIWSRCTRPTFPISNVTSLHCDQM